MRNSSRRLILLRRLGGPEHQVPDALASGPQLALAPQLVPPRGPQVLVVAGDALEADAGHPLAGLAVAGEPAEVRTGLALRAPHPAEHLQRLIRLATHVRAPSAVTAVGATLKPGSRAGDARLMIVLSGAAGPG